MRHRSSIDDHKKLRGFIDLLIAKPEPSIFVDPPASTPANLQQKGLPLPPVQS
jgi:hypothetical protein